MSVNLETLGIDRMSVEQLQPYHRGNNYASDLLWIIHTLDIVDKHRLLIVVSERASVDSASLSNGRILYSSGRPVDDGAVVLTGRGQAFSAGADLKEFQASLQDNATQHWQSGGPWLDGM